MLLHTSRGTLELARGRATDALAAYRTAERLAELVVPRHMVTTWMTAGQLHARLRLGETGQVDAVLAGLDGEQRETGVMRIVLATLRLARGDPQAASDALAAVLDSSVPMPLACSGMAQAFLLEAIARDALGDTPAAGRALEHALDLSEPDGNLLPFLLHPARALLERHRRGRTAHRMLVSQILHLLAQAAPTEPDTQGGLARPPGNLGPGITAVRRGV